LFVLIVIFMGMGAELAEQLTIEEAYMADRL
jgi:hypothetical protein